MQGIYIIINNVNEKVYIGQSNDVEKRWAQHLYNVSYKNYPCGSKLYPAMREIGIENFEYCLLEEVSDESLLDEREIYWINEFQSVQNGYNICEGGGRTLPCHEGERNGRALLTEKQVALIREWYSRHIPRRIAYIPFSKIITMRGFTKVWTGENWKKIRMDVYTPENKEWHRTKAKGRPMPQGLGGNISRKIAPEIVAKMIELRESGLSYEKIAKEVGCSATTAKKYILNRQSSNPQCGRKVRNVETGKEFGSIADAAKWAGCARKTIRTHIDTNHSAGRVPKTEQLATWISIE